METEENGRKRKKTEKNGKNQKKLEATPFRRPLLRNPDLQEGKCLIEASGKRRIKVREQPTEPVKEGKRPPLFKATIDTEIKVKLIPENVSSLSLSNLYSYYLNWADDLSSSCPHSYFTLNYTFAFAFVILKVITVCSLMLP